MTTQSETPRLAPPGAGIPAIERIVGWTILSIRRRRYASPMVSAEFDRERGQIGRLYHPLDAEALRTRVLIPRLRGLEDSSRYWSVLMTLDHLRIVNAQIARVIQALMQNTVPDGQASIAAVKPGPDPGPDVPREYEQSCDHLRSITDRCGVPRTDVRYAHPWFGPLDARGWHVMAAMHMGIHRRQIEEILRHRERRTT